jgi:hypothetical protein
VKCRVTLTHVSQADLIGVVEGYPHDTGGQKVSVLYNGTRSLYERAGFSYLRPKGKRNCVMRRVVK